MFKYIDISYIYLTSNCLNYRIVNMFFAHYKRLKYSYLLKYSPHCPSAMLSKKPVLHLQAPRPLHTEFGVVHSLPADVHGVTTVPGFFGSSKMITYMNQKKF